MRTLKVAELLKREISTIIQQDIKTPLPCLTSVTRVEVTPDLKQAKVFVSIMGNPEQKKTIMEKLKEAKGYIRGLMGRRIVLKYTPDLFFLEDGSIEYGIHISEILNKINAGNKPQDE